MVTINLTDDNSDAAKYKFLSGLAHKNGQKIIIIKKVKGIIYIKNFKLSWVYLLDLNILIIKNNNTIKKEINPIILVSIHKPDDKEKKNVNINLEDEIIKETLVK